jgi:hypothetical protein
MGGEVRMELSLSFTYQADASVELNYTAVLFEGTGREP